MKNRMLAALLAALLGIAACNRDPNIAKKKYVENGNKYFDRGKYKEALIMYKNALKRDPMYGEAYYRAALAEIHLGRFLEAMNDLNRAIEKQPENLDAYVRLANILLTGYAEDQRRPKVLLDELKSLADRMSKRFPGSYDHTRLNGYLSLFQNDLKGALENFEKANALKPYQQDTVLVYMQALVAVGRGAEAEKLGNQMLAQQPSALPIYDALYVYYVKTKRLADAERVLKRKVEKNPAVVQAYLQLASYYYSTQRRPEMLQTLQRVTADSKTFPKGQQNVGDFFLGIRDHDLAVQHYSEGIKQDPKEKATYQKRIIEVLVKQNKNDEATQRVAELLKENPQDADAIAMRASLTLLTGNREQLQSAINDLQTVVTKQPRNFVVRYNLGRAHLAKGNIDQAQNQFEEAIKIRPDYVLPRIALAQMMLQKRDWTKTVQMSTEILSYDTANVPARLLRSRALMGLGDLKQAREDLDRITKQYPNFAEAHLQLATLDLQEGRPKEAENVFRDLYAKSKDSRALIGIVESHLRRNETEAAITLLRDELAKNPQRTEYRVALGNISIMKGDGPGALAEYTKALELMPKSPDLWMRMGDAQRLSGDTKNAVASFHKAKELAPNNPAPYLQLALTYETGGQRNEAKPLYEQVLRLQPNEPVALNNLAYMMADLGTDLDSAMTMAQKARQQRPNDDDIADTLGWIYVKKNLSDSAIAVYRDLVNKQPNRPTFRYHLALALAQKGDRPSAKKECEAALRAKPSKDEETKIRELMAKLG
jgi:tetratricopeptide (TPR) repeat protein